MSKFVEVPEPYHKVPAGKLWPKLTPKERWACDLLCMGMRNRQIAAELGTSEQTVKNLFRVVFIKIGAESRSQLAVLMTADAMAVQDAIKNGN